MAFTKKEKIGIGIGIGILVLLGGLAIAKGIKTKREEEEERKEKEQRNKEFSTPDVSYDETSKPAQEVGSPFGILPNGALNCQRYVQYHDRAWNYVKCNDTWYTQRKGGTGWISLEGNTVAVNKLEAYSGN